jgi:hypothetical protein
MGFQKPNLFEAQYAIQKTLGEIHSPYNDGWTASSCKKDLYLLKCWLEDQYNQLPKFSGEEEWEQERIIELLKK